MIKGPFNRAATFYMAGREVEMQGGKGHICQERYEFMLRWLSAPGAPKKKDRARPGNDFEKRLEVLLKTLRREAGAMKLTARNR